MARVFSRHDLVSSDIEEIGHFIAADNLVAAIAVARELDATIGQIKANPTHYRRYSPKTFRNDNLHRAVCQKFPNYLIFFELTAAEIRVLYVHHAARNFESRHKKRGDGNRCWAGSLGRVFRRFP